MGMILDDFGGISIEVRRESFYIHPSYGYERVCPVCGGDPPNPIMGDCAGGCTKALRRGEVDAVGSVPDHQGTAFGRHWQETPHPEFLIDDLDDLIAALQDARDYIKETR